MNNIVQVLELNDMNDIVKKFQGMVIVLCTSRKLKYKQQKKNFFKDSVKAKDCMFVYVEHENFKTSNSLPEDQFPLYVFFHSGRQIQSLPAHTETSVLPVITHIRLLLKALEEEELEKAKSNNATQEKDETKREENSVSPKKAVKQENTKEADITPEEKEDITKRLLETKKNMEELEKLENLVKFKKLKALQEFEDKQDKSSSSSESDD